MTIKWLASAQDDLDSLDRALIIRILKAVRNKVEKAPREYGQALGNKGGFDLSSFFKLKEDGYRIIYTVTDWDDKELVVITTVGRRDRASVYKTAAERVQECRQLIENEHHKILDIINDAKGQERERE